MSHLKRKVVVRGHVVVAASRARLRDPGAWPSTPQSRISHFFTLHFYLALFMSNFYLASRIFISNFYPVTRFFFHLACRNFISQPAFSYLASRVVISHLAPEFCSFPTKSHLDCLLHTSAGIKRGCFCPPFPYPSPAFPFFSFSPHFTPAYSLGLTYKNDVGTRRTFWGEKAIVVPLIRWLATVSST